MNRLGESREERASEIILGWLGTGAGRRERGVESTEVMHPCCSNNWYLRWPRHVGVPELLRTMQDHAVHA